MVMEIAPAAAAPFKPNRSTLGYMINAIIPVRIAENIRFKAGFPMPR
jgi:hypothetical protein